MNDRIHRFTDPLPPALYWDASFVVSFAYEAALYHQDCAEFLDRLDQAQVISYLSTLTLDEAWSILLRLKVEENHAPTRFWEAYNADPGVIAPYLSELQQLTEEIYTHPRIRLVGVEAREHTSQLKGVNSTQALREMRNRR